VAAIAELSHIIRDGMPSYPGLPRPRIGLHLDHAASRSRYDDQAEFAIGALELVGNTGTYLDSPYHRYPDGVDVSQLPLERLVDLPTVVVDARAEAGEARGLELTVEGSLTGAAVLIRTDWDRRWGSEGYWEPGPYLGAGTVAQLVEHDPALVGVDFWNVDDTHDPARPVHTALLGVGIPIVEHLRALDAVAADARTFVVPLAVVGAPCLPVRAFAIHPS
jgi:kynurenine formamidase